MAAVLTNIRPLAVNGALLARDPPDAGRVQSAVAGILADTALCAWSTVVAGGTAHVNIGYFAHSDELHLYLLSHPGSVHCRNVAHDPTMAVAVFSSSQNWTDPGRGVQLFGRCGQAAESEADDAERIYGRRFQAYAAWKAIQKPGDAGLEYRFYRFVPDRLKILDEAQFGDAVFVAADILRVAS